jgi:hypothetical protein
MAPFVFDVACKRKIDLTDSAKYLVHPFSGYLQEPAGREHHQLHQTLKHHGGLARSAASAAATGRRRRLATRRHRCVGVAIVSWSQEFVYCVFKAGRFGVCAFGHCGGARRDGAAASCWTSFCRAGLRVKQAPRLAARPQAESYAQEQLLGY